MNIKSIKVGQEVKLIGINTQKAAIKHKLFALGLVPGAVLKVITKSWFQGAIAFELPNKCAFTLNSEDSHLLNIIC